MTIRIRGLEKVYRMGQERVAALAGVDLDIAKGEFVAIMGPSGSGKSTLMNILGCLDRPTAGTYELNGRLTHKMGAGALSRVRNEEIGFVFQSFELLQRQSALLNVMLPMLYSRKHWFGARSRAKRALHRVGLGDRMGHRPNQLSGGQRQRVAIARALVNGPSMVLADEPTGNLDSVTTTEIIALLRQLHAEGQTILIVTHEEDVAGNAERIVRLRDGRVLTDFPSKVDPVHQQWLRAHASAAVAQADGGASADAAPSQGGPAGTARSKAGDEAVLDTLIAGTGIARPGGGQGA